MSTLDDRQKIGSRTVLYQLKRDYGTEITYYSVASDTVVDFQTGQQTRGRTHYNIRRACVLSADLTKKFEYDLSFVAANKNFVYGGVFDRDSRIVIIDAVDLSPGFKINTQDYVGCYGKRWNIEKSTELEFQAGWILKVIATDKEQRRFILDYRVEDVLRITDEVTYG